MFQAGVIGSRNCQDWEGVCAFLDDFRQRRGPFVLISGRARGADSLGEAWAISRSAAYLVYVADWERDGKQAGFRRNTLIAADSDVIVAFWDQESRGTQNTLEKARKLGKEIIVIPLNKTGMIVSTPQYWATTGKRA